MALGIVVPYNLAFRESLSFGFVFRNIQPKFPRWRLYTKYQRKVKEDKPREMVSSDVWNISLLTDGPISKSKRFSTANVWNGVWDYISEEDSDGDYRSSKQQIIDWIPHYFQVSVLVLRLSVRIELKTERHDE